MAEYIMDWTNNKTENIKYTYGYYNKNKKDSLLIDISTYITPIIKIEDNDYREDLKFLKHHLKKNIYILFQSLPQIEDYLTVITEYKEENVIQYKKIFLL